MIWSGSPGRRRPWVTVMYGRREITWGEQQSKLECFFVDFNLFQSFRHLHPEWSDGVHGVTALGIEALKLGGDVGRP